MIPDQLCPVCGHPREKRWRLTTVTHYWYCWYCRALKKRIEAYRLLTDDELQAQRVSIDRSREIGIRALDTVEAERTAHPREQ